MMIVHQSNVEETGRREECSLYTLSSSPRPPVFLSQTIQCILITLLLLGIACNSSPSQNNQTAGETVILLHGLFRTGNSMRAMERALIEAGYSPCNVDYPSTNHDIATLAVQHVLPAIERCKGESRDSVDFITHSMGGIMVRYLSSKGLVSGIDKVVMLGPPNQGSELVDELGDMDLFEWMNGPAGSQLGTADTSLVNQLPQVDFELGIIAGDYSFNPFYSNLIPGDDDGKVSVESAKLEGMNDFLVLPVSHSFIMRNKEVIRQTLFFIEQGRFDAVP